MLTQAAPDFLKPVYEHLNQTILAPLEWTDFAHRLDAYLVRRSGTPMMSVDIFPTLACLAAGGSAAQAVSVTSAWLLFILSARIFDDLSDDQQIAQEWHGNDSQTTLAMGLFALGAANSAVAHISSGTVCKEIGCAFNQAVALAAKAQQGSLKPSILSVKEYLSAITAKTGLIFAVGAWSGGVVATASPCQQMLKSLYQYGLNVGLMDQIIDDCQDLAADIAQGIWTLPVIHTLTQLNEEKREALLTTLRRARNDGGKAVETAVTQIHAHHSLTWCLRVAAAYQSRAIHTLKHLPAQNKDYLIKYAKRNDPALVI